MKKTRLGLALVLVASMAGFVATTLAQETPPATPPAGQGRRGGGGGAAPTNISGAMGDMNRALRTLKTEAADPTKSEAALRDIGLLQRDVAIAKSQLPPAVNDLSGDEKTKQANEYRSQMISLMRVLLDLEDAVVAQKADDIKNLLAKIDDAQKKGHADFRK